MPTDTPTPTQTHCLQRIQRLEDILAQVEEASSLLEEDAEGLVRRICGFLIGRAYREAVDAGVGPQARAILGI